MASLKRADGLAATLRKRVYIQEINIEYVQIRSLLKADSHVSSCISQDISAIVLPAGRLAYRHYLAILGQ
jgi:hypothetical protein